MRSASMCSLALVLACVHVLAVAGAPDYYRSLQWCGAPGSLQYLDDGACAKVFPSSYSRDWTSPVWWSEAPPSEEGWATDTGSIDDVHVNTTALRGLLAPDTNACVILIRRTTPHGSSSPDQGQTVYYRYLCGADSDLTEGYQPWSTSKIYAAANAGGHIRTMCPAQGLPSSTRGRHGETPLGDLASIIVSYDSSQGYSSNGLSFYMHGLGGRQRLLRQLRDWYPTQAANLSLGGNYGELAPADLGFVLDNSCAIANDTAHIGLNQLSMLVHADLLRRLVVHDDLPSGQAFPDLEQEDVRTILYGAPESKLFPGLQWGGMSTDPGIFLQSGLPMDEIEQRAQGQWRIFTKMGSGWSSGSGVGEILTAAYASLPVLTGSGVAVPDSGVEFIVLGRASIRGDETLARADKALHTTVANIAEAVYRGRI